MIKRYRFGQVISDLSLGKQSANYHILKDFASIKKINEQFIIDQAKTAISIIQPIREEEDYYKILGSDPDSTTDELRFKWISLMKKFHPDKAGEIGLEKTKIINKAYNVLSDADRRKNYDEKYLPASRIKVTDPAEYQFRNKKFVCLVIFVVLLLSLGYIHNSRQIAKIAARSEGVINYKAVKPEDHSSAITAKDDINERDVNKNTSIDHEILQEENTNKVSPETTLIDDSENKIESKKLPLPSDGLDDKGIEDIAISDNINVMDEINNNSDISYPTKPDEFAKVNKNQSEIIIHSEDLIDAGTEGANSATQTAKPDILTPEKDTLSKKNINVSDENQEYEIEKIGDTRSDDNKLWKASNTKISNYHNDDGKDKDSSVDKASYTFQPPSLKSNKTSKPQLNTHSKSTLNVANLPQHENLPDKSSVYLVISDYITAYKNRDIGKLQGLFSNNAKENGKPLQEVIKSYRDNFERIDILAYDIKFDNVHLAKNKADVYGDFIITFRTNTDKRNQKSQGNIYWNLFWDQDSWFINEINYEISRTSKDDAIKSAF